MVPRTAHFVYGLRAQLEPFPFLHYASLESCRRVLGCETIYFHHKHRPWGPWWDRIEPHVTLVPVDDVSEVLAADYTLGAVPEQFRYAHHTDFIRLDALIEYGGIYADIDTIFVRPFPDELYEQPFVIGRELAVVDERSGALRPSLCNALLMSEPGSLYARVWRAQMAAALNGTWSNHSGFLSEELSRRMPEAVRVEDEVRFFPFAANRAGLAALLEERRPVPPRTLSVHLWSHLWWDRSRVDYSDTHGERYVPSFIRGGRTTLAALVEPYLPNLPGRDRASGEAAWRYFSLDEESGYGVAARRCIAALEDAEIPVRWTPFVPGSAWGLGYEPFFPIDEPVGSGVLVAHLVPEYLPAIRAANPGAFIVAHTVWDTDRIPAHWVGCLEEADLIVVPSYFSAEAMRRSPLRVPVAVVPHVAPPPVPLQVEPLSDVDDETVVFYTIAEWNERKAVARTIEAYLRAFDRDNRVLLIVKTSPREHPTQEAVGWSAAAGEGTTAWTVARILAAHPDHPAVRLITRVLAPHEILSLHHRGDCFVSLARCEGWGLGAFDAAAYGNPVVTTGFGGQLDYLAGSPYLVNFELTRVDHPAGMPSYTPDQRWAEPDVDHAAALLREIASDRARPITGDIGSRYRPAVVAAAFIAAVAAAGGSGPDSPNSEKLYAPR